MPKTTKSSRSRLIPTKRSLLPPKSNQHKVCKVLNPSAIPAETRMKQSHEEATQKRNEFKNQSVNKDEFEDEEDYKPMAPRIEVSFSMPPQPFLDPPTWEAMLKHSQQRLAAQSDESSPENIAETESSERLRQRVDRETEYGSMAIRGRSSVRGRGKGRGHGNVYWGGRN
ncbi:uncharacterized protein N7529_005610 [Penicillium soppii]|jgi:hypothetical protein|uniref:uncharacterized protein n=1 Tax=Penicillium soppii TaxID=69789 RepID=UPI00254750BD|nr:uncharacterized protein N7529_005610 [Penicillium soppii]KAJ5863694.1 hypothetical protein N7529_005610 [Penicillium soppii]